MQKILSWFLGLPSGEKIWFGSILAAILAANLWNKLYGFGILLSLAHPDFAILYWLETVGVGKRSAIGIAVICGAIGIYNINWVAEQSIPFFKKHWGGQTETSANKKHSPRFAIASYFALILYPVDPWCGASLGIAFYKKMGLKKWPSLIMLNVGNSLKMIAIGLGMSWAHKATNSPYVATIATMAAIAILLFYTNKK